MIAGIISVVSFAVGLIIWATKELVNDVIKKLYSIEEKLDQIKYSLKDIEKSKN